MSEGRRKKETMMRDSSYGSWKRKSNKRNIKKNSQLKVNNRLTMDNNERIKNVAMGYQIQASRLLRMVKDFSTDLETMKEHKAEIDKATEIMKEIQRIMWKMGSETEKLQKHISNSAYCKVAMIPYVKQLEGIIAETDTLVKGQAYEQEH